MPAQVCPQQSTYAQAHGAPGFCVGWQWAAGAVGSARQQEPWIMRGPMHAAEARVPPPSIPPSWLQVGLKRGQGDLAGAAELLKQYLTAQVGQRYRGGYCKGTVKRDELRVAAAGCGPRAGCCAFSCSGHCVTAVLARHAKPAHWASLLTREPAITVQGSQDWQAWEEAADLYLQLQVRRGLCSQCCFACAIALSSDLLPAAAGAQGLCSRCCPACADCIALRPVPAAVSHVPILALTRATFVRQPCVVHDSHSRGGV